ncbi:arsenate reductase/protein-tyrosine-phosphatase family protein, partial [Clostridioides difficile]
MTFSVLSVCTGNVCRSPLAEQLIARQMREFDVSVRSAGVWALVGEGAPEPARRIAAECGLDVSAHVAEQVDEGMIRRSDLILGMARDHRRQLVEMAPSAMRRSFTLREFARLAEAAEPDLSEAVRSAHARSAEDGMRAAVALAASL